MSSGGCWRTTRGGSPVRRPRRPRRRATGPRRWTCCSGRARDDRHCERRTCRFRAAAPRGRAGQGGGPGSRRARPREWPAARQPRTVLALVTEPAAPVPDPRHISGAACRYCWTGWGAARPDWQQRWLASGADAAGRAGRCAASWLVPAACAGVAAERASSLLVLVGADVIRPSLAGLAATGHPGALARNMICSRDPGGFARLREFCPRRPGVTPAPGPRSVPVRRDHRRQGRRARRHHHRRRAGGAGRRARGPRPARTRARRMFRVLREMGVFGPGAPTLREILDAGQRTVEELVDRYPIACRPVRDLIVDYLKERQPAIDYVTLRTPFQPAGQVLLGRPGTATIPASTRCACPAMSPPRGSSGCGPRPRRPPPERARRRRSPRSGSATSTPRQRPRLLPRPGRVGAGRPGPVGTVGGPLPDPARRPGAAQVHPPPQGQDGRPHPRAAPGPASPGPHRRPVARRRPGAARRGPPGRARPGIHRRRADPDPGRPAARRPRNVWAARPRRRHAPRPEPGGRPRVLGMGDHRGPPRSPASGSRNCSSYPTTAWSSTGCPTPASWCRCCRSPRPRPTPNGCWSSAPSSPTCSARSSAGSAAATGRPAGPPPTTATSRSGCRRPRCCSSAAAGTEHHAHHRRNSSPTARRARSPAPA